jgi:hypothetical protein
MSSVVQFASRVGMPNACAVGQTPTTFALTLTARNRGSGSVQALANRRSRWHQTLDRGALATQCETGLQP